MAKNKSSSIPSSIEPSTASAIASMVTGGNQAAAAAAAAAVAAANPNSQEASDYNQYWQYYQNWSQYAAWSQYSQQYPEYAGSYPYDQGGEGSASATDPYAGYYDAHATGDKSMLEGDEFELVGKF